MWVRIGSILFFLTFYVIYIFITSGLGALAFMQIIASGQRAVWFIPFVWLGMMLYSFVNGWIFQEFVFMMLSVLFILSLFYAAVALNRRYGLYEPPSITVSRGVYAPRTGFLDKLGFSAVEAALIRKDLKAFTCRRELMYIFRLPIVLVIFPLIQTGATSRYTQTGSIPSLALVFLMPSAESFLLMFALSAISLANGIKGAEFTELLRPRMIRPQWAIINLITCLLATLAILAPFIPYLLILFQFAPLLPRIDPYQAAAISATIACMITLLAYKLALRNAGELIARAQT